MSHGSVTYWLGRLQAGDPASAKQLWDRYYVRVVRVARATLRGADRRVADEEDVALAAFNSFYRAVAGGVFERLEDRSDLWQVLVPLTSRKATDQRRRAGAMKRGAAQTFEGDDFLPGRDPDPQLAAMAAEEAATLLGRLPDDDLDLRRIAVMKLEGFSAAEIGAACGCSLRTVERRICLIRKFWEQPDGRPLPAGTPTQV
ncbi:ECF-type sigma factor [Zavarzinella formosa]|uniref:ECF-type sigma factor n=1 Tax=Zavarzinella formosa TaxID=360055 RepID=UPI0003128BC1|nr:ECF-type sigma factor [Zavarzinella formosa]